MTPSSFVLLLRSAALALLLAFALPAGAAASGRAGAAAAMAPGVSVTMISSPQLTLDSNKPCQEGPQAAYVAFRVSNTSGTTLTNLRATITGFASGIVLGGGQAAEQYVGRLEAGTSRVLYWFVSYSCLNVGSAATLTVRVTDATAGFTSGSGTVTTTSMVSAQAGGVLTSGTMGAGAVVGQTIEFDVAYEFGGASVGDSYNLQVAGNPAFNAGCFQLVRMQIFSSGITAAPAAAAGTLDTPYFSANNNQGGSKIPLVVRYSFKYLCANTVSTARPYSNQFSGGQLKYSSNYDIFVGPTLPGATNPFTVSKTASPAVLSVGGTATFTVSVQNPSAFAAEVDSIVDVLPAGVTYDSIAAGSGVTAANSGTVPAAGSTGRIVFRGPYAIARGATLSLVYKVTLPSQAGQFTNSASAATGVTILGAGAATATVKVGADLAVAKTGPASVMAGDTVRYVVTVSNTLGPATARTVVVTDTLPAGMTFVSATRGGTAVGRVVTWPALDSLIVGQSRADTVVALAPVKLGDVTNVAAVSAASPDSSAANSNGSAAGSRVTTSVTTSVDVLPKGLSAPQPCLQGPGCKQVFTVANLSPTATPYDLLARVGLVAPTTSVFLQVDSITGPGITTRVRPDSVRLTLSGKTTSSYTVWYRVLSGDTTVVNADFLRARATADTTLRSEGWTEIRPVRPVLTLAKSVSPAGTLAPGTDLTYTMAFSNVGSYSAEGVRVEDAVPPQVLFKVGSPGLTVPAGISFTVEYSQATSGDASWNYVPGTNGCGATGVPSGYDGCVRRVRWVLTGTLDTLAAGTTEGKATFVARIR